MFCMYVMLQKIPRRSVHSSVINISLLNDRSYILVACLGQIFLYLRLASFC